MTANFKKILKTQLAIFSVVASSFGAHANLISNGGFEQPVTGPGGYNSGYTAFLLGYNIGPWTVVGAPVANVALTPSTEYSSSVGPTIYFLSQEGSQSLDLTGDTDNGGFIGVEQSFSTVPGQLYSLSFYVGAITTTDWAPHQGNASVEVRLNGSLFQTAVNSNLSGDATDWKAFNYTFTAAGPSTALAFMNRSAFGVGNNGLDNVVVVAVPEPGTAGMMLLGAGLLVRRKKK